MVKEKAEFVCSHGFRAKAVFQLEFCAECLQPARASLLMSNCTLIPHIRALVWEFRAARIPMFEFLSDFKMQVLVSAFSSSPESPMDKLGEGNSLR